MDQKDNSELPGLIKSGVNVDSFFKKEAVKAELKEKLKQFKADKEKEDFKKFCHCGFQECEQISDEDIEEQTVGKPRGDNWYDTLVKMQQRTCTDDFSTLLKEFDDELKELSTALDSFSSKFEKFGKEVETFENQWVFRGAEAEDKKTLLAEIEELFCDSGLNIPKETDEEEPKITDVTDDYASVDYLKEDLGECLLFLGSMLRLDDNNVGLCNITRVLLLALGTADMNFGKIKAGRLENLLDSQIKFTEPVITNYKPILITELAKANLELDLGKEIKNKKHIVKALNAFANVKYSQFGQCFEWLTEVFFSAFLLLVKYEKDFTQDKEYKLASHTLFYLCISFQLFTNN